MRASRTRTTSNAFVATALWAVSSGKAQRMDRPQAGGTTLIALLQLVSSYDDFSSSVTLLHIFDSLRDIAQLVSSVDDGFHLPALH